MTDTAALVLTGPQIRLLWVGLLTVPGRRGRQSAEVAALLERLEAANMTLLPAARAEIGAWGAEIKQARAEARKRAQPSPRG